jgi:hypothetical protein
MDVKNSFLNGVIQEEVFVRHPQVSITPNILIECTSFQRLCTGLSKCRRLGTLGLSGIPGFYAKIEYSSYA